MPDIESKGDFLVFRYTLTKLERLVDLRNDLLVADHTTVSIGEAIIDTLELLAKYDVNTTELSAIEELERLAEMRVKVAEKNRWIDGLCYGEPFDKLIDSKIDFIKNGSFSRLARNGDGGIEAMTALERLAALNTKISLRSKHGMYWLLESRIREFVRRTRPNASSRHDLGMGRRFY